MNVEDFEAGARAAVAAIACEKHRPVPEGCPWCENERLRARCAVAQAEMVRLRELGDIATRKLASVLALMPPKDITLADGRVFAYVGPWLPTRELLDLIREAAQGRGALDRAVFDIPEQGA